MKKRFNPLVLLPGMAFWALLISGIITGNNILITIAVVVGGLSVITLVTIAIKASSAAKAARRRLWQEGTPGTARIVSIGTNGGSFNDHPYVDLELDVTVGAKPAYRASVRALISQLAIPRIQPECQINVHVDPADPSKLVVDAALTPYGHG